MSIHVLQLHPAPHRWSDGCRGSCDQHSQGQAGSPTSCSEAVNEPAMCALGGARLKERIKEFYAIRCQHCVGLHGHSCAHVYAMTCTYYNDVLLSCRAFFIASLSLGGARRAAQLRSAVQRRVCAPSAAARKGVGRRARLCHRQTMDQGSRFLAPAAADFQPQHDEAGSGLAFELGVDGHRPWVGVEVI